MTSIEHLILHINAMISLGKATNKCLAYDLGDDEYEFVENVTVQPEDNTVTFSFSGYEIIFWPDHANFNNEMIDGDDIKEDSFRIFLAPKDPYDLWPHHDTYASYILGEKNALPPVEQKEVVKEVKGHLKNFFKNASRPNKDLFITIDDLTLPLESSKIGRAFLALNFYYTTSKPETRLSLIPSTVRTKLDEVLAISTDYRFVRIYSKYKPQTTDSFDDDIPF